MAKHHSTVMALAMATALALTAGAAHAAQREVKKSGNAKNTTGAAQMKFHVRINSDTSMTVKRALLGNNGSFHEGMVTGDGTTRLTIVWNVVVPNNDTIGWTVRFNQNEKNDWIPTSSGWGDPPQPAGPGLREPTLGLTVLTDGSYFLNNGYAEPVNYGPVSYDVFAVDPLTDEDIVLALEEGAFPVALGQALPGGTVAPGVPEHVATLAIREGEILYAGFETSFASDPDNTALIFQGHEHQAATAGIPAAGEWGLLVLGMVLAGAAVWVIIRRV